jgi:hypothetical protein
MNARALNESPAQRARAVVDAAREALPPGRPVNAEVVAHLLGSVAHAVFMESDMRAALERRVSALEARLSKDQPR